MRVSFRKSGVAKPSPVFTYLEEAAVNQGILANTSLSVNQFRSQAREHYQSYKSFIKGIGELQKYRFKQTLTRLPVGSILGL